MTTSHKTAWLAALRSGNYLQGRSYLRVADSHCCLGVLLDTIDPDAWTSSRGYNTVEGLSIYIWTDSESNLTGETVPPLGIINMDSVNILASLNDASGFNFHAIANFIEQHFDENLSLRSPSTKIVEKLKEAGLDRLSCAYLKRQHKEDLQ